MAKGDSFFESLKLVQDPKPGSEGAMDYNRRAQSGETKQATNTKDENPFVGYLRDALFPSVKKTGDAEQDKQNAISAFLDSLGKLLGGIPVENAGSYNDAANVEQAKIPKAPSFRKGGVSTDTWVDGSGRVIRGIRDPRTTKEFEKYAENIQPISLPTRDNYEGGR